MQQYLRPRGPRTKSGAFTKNPPPRVQVGINLDGGDLEEALAFTTQRAPFATTIQLTPPYKRDRHVSSF